MNTPTRIATEDSNFVRDTHSKALLNTNVAALTRHRRQQAKAQEYAMTTARVITLEAQLATVTAMIDALTQRMSG